MLTCSRLVYTINFLSAFTFTAVSQVAKLVAVKKMFLQILLIVCPVISVALVGEVKGNTHQACKAFELSEPIEWDESCCGKTTCTRPTTMEALSLYVFPSMTINCTGTLIRLEVNGEKIESSDREPKIQIWRMSATGSDYYELEYSIPLNTQCCNSHSAEANCAYRVKAGDTIGVQLPQSNMSSFLVHFSRMTQAFTLPVNAVNFSTKNLTSDKKHSAQFPMISMDIIPDSPMTMESSGGSITTLEITSDSSVNIETSGGSTTASTDTPLEFCTYAKDVCGSSDNQDAGQGVIIAVLLFVAVLLLVLIIVIIVTRRKKKGSYVVNHNGTHLVNPVYDVNERNISRETQEIANRRHHFTSANMNSISNDYSEITDTQNHTPGMTSSTGYYHVLEESSEDSAPQALPPMEGGDGSQARNVSGYETPITTLPKIYSEEPHYNPDDLTLKFFEECETYWSPSSNANELYEQLSRKKYREIPRNQIELTKDFLGSGAFGSVNKGLWQSPGGAIEVAVKTNQSDKEEEKVKFLQEAAIMGQFRHPNVVKLMGVITKEEPVMIVLELLSNGSLDNFLSEMIPKPDKTVSSDTPKQLLKFCQQISCGMEYLSRKAFVHRDLAARNILVSEDKVCKVSDFGMSRDLMNESYYVSQGGKIPVKWTAPEAIHYKKYSTASDVWSFGCVMYEIWSLGHKPFEAFNNNETIKQVEDGVRLPPPPGCPRELYRLMMECWCPESSRRPTFAQLVEMLSQADFELLLWREEDTQIGPQVSVVGAPLEASKNLYSDLQRVYMQQ